MKNINFMSVVSEAIENYYRYNPDTLTPLLMLALATRGKLFVSTQVEKRMFACIRPEEVIGYDWVQLDEQLLERIAAAADRKEVIAVSGVMDDELDGELGDIFELFREYDTVTVEQEFHHRLGILYHHSSNEASEKPHRAYATVWLAERLIETPVEWLREHFITLAYEVLVRSGIQPDRPRIKVAETLCALLQYDGDGTVYNPFTGGGIVAAMIQAGDKLYADGDVNAKLTAAAGLLIYGMGGSVEHFQQHDSQMWRYDRQFDYIVSTYRGYIDGQSAFDFCLQRCFTSLNVVGKFAGIVSPRDIFDKRSEQLREAIRRDWLDTVVLLPFGEVAVLINADKRPEFKGVLRFMNFNKTAIDLANVREMIESDLYTEYFQLEDVARMDDFFQRICLPKIGGRPGFTYVRLSDVVERIERKTYRLDQLPKEQRVLAYVNRNEDYTKDADGQESFYMKGIEKRPISFLFEPAYFLDADALIVNKCGNLEPRFFDASQGKAFFQDGYAFRIKDEYAFQLEWIKNELTRNYIFMQLYPYGKDVLVPERITEDQVFNLLLAKECPDARADAMKLQALKKGFVLTNNRKRYVIDQFLNYGGFGITYVATSVDLQTGEKDTVVIKEFFMYDLFYRKEDKVYYEGEKGSKILISAKKRFEEEVAMMNEVSSVPHSHVAPVLDCIACMDTNTSYYVMPYYRKGSLFQIMKSGQTYNEKLIIRKIVIPMCRALHVMHSKRMLHLDIKPENIVVDDQGDAVLIDFGMANKYDDQGCITSEPIRHKKTACTAPEVTKGTNVKFGPQLDVYELAATLFYFVTRCKPQPIVYLSDGDVAVAEELRQAGCSDGFIRAIVAGLQESAGSRPESIEAFLHLFPGCEEIDLDISSHS